MGAAKFHTDSGLPNFDLPPISVLRISRLARRSPNDFSEEAIRRVYEMSEQFGLVVTNQSFFDHITMSGYLWPYTTPERLITLVYFNAIGFYIDDTIGSEITLLPESDALALRMSIAEKTQTIFVDGITPRRPDKYDLALLQLRDGVANLSTPDFANRFFQLLLEHWRDSTTTWETEGTYLGGIEQYIPLRRSCSGMLPTVLLIEYAKDHFMPEGALDLVPSLADAINAVADIGGLTNDLFSYAKEVIDQGTTLNMIPVLQRERGYVMSRFAILDGLEIVDGKFAAFQKAIEDANSETAAIEDPDYREQMQGFLDDYVDGMWDMISGAYHWQTETNRYRNERNPFPDLRTPIDTPQQKVYSSRTPGKAGS